MLVVDYDLFVDYYVYVCNIIVYCIIFCVYEYYLCVCGVFRFVCVGLCIRVTDFRLKFTLVCVRLIKLRRLYAGGFFVGGVFHCVFCGGFC